MDNGSESSHQHVQPVQPTCIAKLEGEENKGIRHFRECLPLPPNPLSNPNVFFFFRLLATGSSYSPASASFLSTLLLQ